MHSTNTSFNGKRVSISVITVTLNAASLLPDLVESLRQQTDHEFEWIIVDGASTDGTLDIIKASGLVTQWISEPDFGIYDAMNKAVKTASGEYYLVVGADDRLKPEAIALYRKAASESNADLITGAIELKDRIKQPSETFIRRQSIFRIISSHSVGCLIRKSLHQRFGFYTSHYPICADREFLLTSYLNGATLARFHDVVGYFSNGTSERDLLGCLVENYRIQVKTGSPLLLEMALLFIRTMRSYRTIRMQLKA